MALKCHHRIEQLMRDAGMTENVQREVSKLPHLRARGAESTQSLSEPQ